MSEDPEVGLAYLNFLAKYQRSYTSKIDYSTRFENFKKTYSLVNTHNANPDRTYDMGINQFADLDESEYFLNAQPPEMKDIY